MPSCSIEDRIRRFIVDNFLFGQEDEPLLEEDSFFEKGLLDSTGILEFVKFLETDFAITIGHDDLVPENLDSIQCAADLVRRKSCAQGVASV